MSSDSKKNRKRRLEQQFRAEREATSEARPEKSRDQYLAADDLWTLETTKAGSQCIQVTSTVPCPLKNGYGTYLSGRFSQEGHAFTSRFTICAFEDTLHIECPSCGKFKKRLFRVELGSHFWICGDCKKVPVTHIVGEFPTYRLADTEWDSPADLHWWTARLNARQIASDRAWVNQEMAKAQQRGDQHRIAFLDGLIEKINRFEARNR